jgi:hypothetical protein
LGSNYRDFKKFKDIPIIAAPVEELVMPKKSVTEQFAVIELPPDSRMDNLIYESQELKKDMNR